MSRLATSCVSPAPAVPALGPRQVKPHTSQTQMNLLVAAKTLRTYAASALSLLAMTAGAFASTNETVTLAWNANPETNIAGYRLRYGTTSGVYPYTVEAGTNLTATATGLTSGTTYYFTLVAYNTAGQTSASSAELPFTTPGNPNSAPVADVLSLTTIEDTATAVTLSGSDVDGDPISYTVVSNPTKGSLSGTAPNLTYTPNANATGSDNFTYRASDGVLNSTTVTASITITPVEDPPLANSSTVTTNEDTNVAVNLSASDPEGASLIYTLLSSPLKGTLTGTPPNLTYKPNANANGADSFTFKVSDGALESGVATVSVSITPVNDAPVANAQSLSTAEDTPLAVSVSGSDVEGSALSYSLVTAPSKGSLSGTLPNVTYTPQANYNGSDSFVFRVNDGSTNSANATVSISVTPVNDAPVATSSSASTSKNNAVAVNLPATDVDGNPLTYTVVSGPANGTLSGSGANLTYTPATDFTGSDSFTWRASDGTLQSAVATVSISVVVSNAAPVANAQSVTATEDTAKAITVSGSDPENAALTYTLVSGPTRGSLSGSLPNVTYTPNANANGGDSFVFRVNDGTNNSANATVSITITAVNDAPVAAASSVTTVRNTAVSVPLSGSDVDGNPLTYIPMSLPANGSLSGVAPNLVYTPNQNFTGSDSFAFRVNDGTVYSPNATVSITVSSGPNQRPSAHSKNYTVMKGKAVSVQLSGQDPESAAISYRVTRAPLNGTLTGTPPNLVYKPKAKYSGPDDFQYVASDGSLDSLPATMSVKVKAKNLLPVATPKAITVNMNSSGAALLAGSDADSDPLSYRVTIQPKFGTLSGAAPNLIYTPNAGFKGKDSFQFLANDGVANSKPAIMSVNVVNPNNRAPVPVNKVLTVEMNKSTPTVLDASDADADKLTYKLLSKPSAGKLTGVSPIFTYKPAKGFVGVVTVSFVANDGSVDSAVGTITINVVKPAVVAARSLTAHSAGAGDNSEIQPPVLSLERDATRASGLLLHASGSPGAVFDLESSPDLSAWTFERAVTIGDEGSTTLEMTIPEGSRQGFYRLSEP